ncbi:MAG: helix-turn-helix domain-containing protein [archaeon]|jgi:sugar-specific transcriptional regulator TrmB
MEELEIIGFTKNESRVYLELLKLGKSTKTPIAYKSGVSTSKVYDILERLRSKGLVSISTINKVKYFKAAPPNQLNHYLEKKESELANQKKMISNIMPTLNEYTNKNEEKFVTKYYTGTNGLKTAINEILDLAKENTIYYGMGITEKKNEMLNINWVHWHRKRAKKNITSKLIFGEIDNQKYYNNLKNISKTEVKIMNAQTPSALAILDGRVLIVNYTEVPVAIIIEDKNISETFITFFNNIWNII